MVFTKKNHQNDKERGLMKTGLTVGKFAPLHKGHELLIETALKEMDELIVIVYSAKDIPELSLEMRCHWLKTLYPKVQVIQGQYPPTDIGYTEAIQKKHEDYILSLVKSYKIDAFYSSETYGIRMSRALNCPHRLIDFHREKVPISGRMIRNNLKAYEAYVHPVVYKDLKMIYG